VPNRTLRGLKFFQSCCKSQSIAPYRCKGRALLNDLVSGASVGKVDSQTSCVICEKLREDSKALHEGPTFHCERCANNTRHLHIPDAAVLASVSRSTVYWWMRRGSIHWTTLPCEHRVICLESLNQIVGIASDDTGPSLCDTDPTLSTNQQLPKELSTGRRNQHGYE